MHANDYVCASLTHALFIASITAFSSDFDSLSGELATAGEDEAIGITGWDLTQTQDAFVRNRIWLKSPNGPNGGGDTKESERDSGQGRNSGRTISLTPEQESLGLLMLGRWPCAVSRRFPSRVYNYNDGSWSLDCLTGEVSRNHDRTSRRRHFGLDFSC